ncbi:MAG TPA: phosphatase PAP2 family protein, partial [Dissulfurispiraceae bacterium]|nr:phosphatase PAP2 family protein [Dissulfurispiraceae bacterium]
MLDNQLFFLINQGCANTLFDMIMPFITSRGYLLLIPYLFVLFFKAFGAERRKEDVQQAIWAIFFCVAAVLLGDWASNELKAATARMRPCEALDGVHLLVGCTKSASMPSNHATNSFAAAVALLLFTRQQLNGILWWYPLAPAALIAFSRVSVGVHYPSDVLAGTVLGSAVAFMLYGAFRLFQSCFAKKPHETILAAVLMSLSLIRIYYVLHGPLDLSPDEAHYWEWARRLDLSYYSKGPAVAYIIAAGTALFGDTVFGVRFFALIFSAFGSILLYRLMVGMYMPQDAADAKGRESAQNSALWGALMLQIVPLFAPFGIILTIDSPFLFCWILGLFLFWRAVQRQAGFRALTAWLLVGLA